MLPALSVLGVGASCWAASGLTHAAPLLHGGAARTRPTLLQISESLDAGGGTTDTGSFFTAWDGRSEDGISPEGAVPLGEDLIEDDLRQLFSLEEDDNMTDGTEMDDLAVRPPPTTPLRPSLAAHQRSLPLPLVAPKVCVPACVCARAAHVQASQGAGRRRLQGDL